MNVTLRQLSYFVALAEARNFGRAAQIAHISQPALSVQIKELERILDASLVERLPRDIRLTRAGREVEARARRVLAEVAELEGAARRRGLAGRLALGVIPTVAPYLLPRALPALRASGIARDFRVREAQTADLLTALDAGRLDAVVIAGPAPDATMLGQPLFEDRFLLAGTAARLAGLGPSHERLRPTGIDPEQLLLLDEGHCLADQALEVCGLDRRRVRLDLGASSLATLSGLVAQGFGLTFLPEIALATENAAQPGMAVLRFARPEPRRQISLYRRRATGEEAWFAELADHLAGAGTAMTAAARRAVPPTDAD